MPTTPNLGVPGGPPIPFDEMTLIGALIAFVLLVASVIILWLLRARNGNGGARRPTPIIRYSSKPRREHAA